jgi:poly(3-hydroxybutyrate) depolymerase
MSISPLDLVADSLVWSTAVALRRPPQWSTPHRIVREWPLARLRDFSEPSSEPSSEPQLPVLLLPPQAGHDSCIVDHAPGQSQIRTARDAGVRALFSLDWKGATLATRDATIDDYVEMLDEVIEHLGGQAHLVGDCQGGWMAVIYAALRPSSVASLTIAGAPVDFHAGEPVIGEWLNRLSPRGELRLYRSIVAAHGGVLPGSFLLQGFKALQPGASRRRRLELLPTVRDPRAVERYRRFEDWFEHTQAIPGAFYLWIVEHLFLGNELVAGTLTVSGEKVDLGRLTMPLHLLAGEADHITPPAQVFALADHAASRDVVRHRVAGGHLGLFMGREALRTAWRDVFSGLAH